VSFSDQDVDVTGVDDRRGRGGGAVAIGGGGGIVGLLVLLAYVFLGGGDPSQLVPQDGQVQGEGTNESAGQREQRWNSEGAIEK